MAGTYGSYIEYVFKNSVCCSEIDYYLADYDIGI